ncbi:hypothetical protein MJI20_32400, partial [Salmonella enterica subsp. enterica serovar Anatum]|nr:hypothetical protein [Salmonella enterica subsp. enterica serovar Anatum]
LERVGLETFKAEVERRAGIKFEPIRPYEFTGRGDRIGWVKGIKLFAITDHGPDMEDAPHHWHFINMRIWPRLVDGVGILRG